MNVDGVCDCEQLGKLDTLNKKIGFQVELNVEFILLSSGEGFLDRQPEGYGITPPSSCIFGAEYNIRILI